MTGAQRLTRDALTHLVAWASRRGLGAAQIRAELEGVAQQVDELVVRSVGPSAPTPRAIIAQVESFYRLDGGAVLGNSRVPRLVLARQIAYYLARRFTGFSYTELGAAFHRDHTTVLHGVQRVELLVATHHALAQDVAELRVLFGDRPAVSP